MMTEQKLQEIEKLAGLGPFRQLVEELRLARKVIEQYRHCRHASIDCFCVKEAREYLAGSELDMARATIQKLADKVAVLERDVATWRVAAGAHPAHSVEG